jgi:hypothetical protein
MLPQPLGPQDPWTPVTHIRVRRANHREVLTAWFTLPSSEALAAADAPDGLTVPDGPISVTRRIDGTTGLQGPRGKIPFLIF